MAEETKFRFVATGRHMTEESDFWSCQRCAGTFVLGHGRRPVACPLCGAYTLEDMPFTLEDLAMLRDGEPPVRHREKVVTISGCMGEGFHLP